MEAPAKPGDPGRYNLDWVLGFTASSVLPSDVMCDVTKFVMQLHFEFGKESIWAAFVDTMLLSSRPTAFTPVVLMFKGPQGELMCREGRHDLPAKRLWGLPSPRCPNPACADSQTSLAPHEADEDGTGRFVCSNVTHCRFKTAPINRPPWLYPARKKQNTGGFWNNFPMSEEQSRWLQSEVDRQWHEQSKDPAVLALRAKQLTRQAKRAARR